MSEPVVVVGPAGEPVTVAEVREHLRIDHTHEDRWLLAAIRTAREDVEGYTGRALLTQTLEWSLDGWPEEGALRLPRPPLRSVSWVRWTGTGGTVTTVDAAAVYLVDAVGSPGRIVPRPGVGWPAGELAGANGVVVRYEAGYGGKAGDVPARIRHAVLMMVGHLYENREATLVGGQVVELPMGVQRLLYPFRVFM